MKKNSCLCLNPGLSMVLIFLLLCFGVSCSGSKTIRKPPEFKVFKSTLAKDVSETKTAGVPVNSSDSFTTQDEKVVSLIQLKNITGKHKIRWEWFLPDGSLYYASKESAVKALDGKFIKDTSVWHRMYINKEKASAYPGTWRVKVFFDDDIISTKNFEIKEPGISGDSGKLFVTTIPEEASVRILNIKPKYFNGIELNSGQYDLEVSFPGYEQKRMWVTVAPGIENKVEVQLEKPVSAVNFLSKRNSYAVIIGISHYQYSGDNGLADLVFADDDAEAFRNSLLRMGWSRSHIKTLINENAKRNDILIALESWLTKVGPDDMVVLFWSGHGFPDPDDPEKVYFACYDTNINIPATGYRMDRVRAILQERNAKNVVILADTCHAGKLITRGSKGISVQPYIKKLKRENRVPKGWIYMVGADTDRQAIEHSSWSNGAFTHTLLKGLAGPADGYQSVAPKDGFITMREIRAYMESVMPDETQRVLGTAKRPIITTSTGDPDIWNISLDMK